MNQHEKTLTLQNQVSKDIEAKVKALGRYHSGCAERVIKIKDEDMMLKLASTVDGERLLYAVSKDGLFDFEHDKYPFDTLSIDELVALVEYINQL